MLSDLAASRRLVWPLFIRDVSAQYRQSILGYVWMFVPPLLASLPLVYLNAQGLVKIDHTAIPYAAYAITGMMVWQVFADALIAPLRSINGARGMLIRINLPREAILLSALAQVALGFLVRLMLLAGVLAWFHLLPPVTAVLFPLGVLSLALAGSAVGILLTPLGLLYGDVQRAVPVLATCLMFLTPVLYPVPQSGIAATIAAVNPLTSLIVPTRDWLTIGTTAHASHFVVVTSIAFAVLMLAWVKFRVAMPHLIARIGN